MAEITAAMVRDLREKTGAGMMDCKKALTENGGDMEAAIDWLRKKGLSAAAKKSGRVAAEGLIGVASGPNVAAMVEVNAETDFVARNDHFQGLVKLIADVALSNGGDAKAIKAAKVGDKTVQDAIASAIATIGENMNLRRATSLSVGNGAIGTYMHNSISEGLGKIVVLVALESSGNVQELTAFGRLVAMHIAATNPVAVDPSGIPADVIEREKSVLADKAKAQGKPANVVEKIVESGLKTFYKEVCLLDQPFIHDDGKSVAQAVKAAEAKVGAPIKVVSFVRFALGEGVEKDDSDFAAEVAAAAGKS